MNDHCLVFISHFNRSHLCLDFMINLILIILIDSNHYSHFFARNNHKIILNQRCLTDC